MFSKKVSSIFLIIMAVLFWLLSLSSVCAQGFLGIQPLALGLGLPYAPGAYGAGPYWGATGLVNPFQSPVVSPYWPPSYSQYPGQSSIGYPMGYSTYPTYPGYPTTGYPTYPPYTGYPTYPTYPSYPTTGYPTYPTYTGYPTYPTYPSYPTTGYPTYPTYTGYPGYPGSGGYVPSTPYYQYADIMIDHNADGKVVKIDKGKTLGITLPSNYATGYQWVLDTASLNTTVAQKKSSQFLTPAGTMVGTGGSEQWVFNTVGVGITTIRLEYRRYWETFATDTFEIEVDVQ
ncbi:MAG: protease inhibitor I42 family protein [bacterium]